VRQWGRTQAPGDFIVVFGKIDRLTLDGRFRLILGTEVRKTYKNGIIYQSGKYQGIQPTCRHFPAVSALNVPNRHHFRCFPAANGFHAA